MKMHILELTLLFLLFVFIFRFCCCIIFSSRYVTEYHIGSIVPGLDVLKIGEYKNHYFIHGLVSFNKPRILKDLIGDRKNYIIITKRKFLDNLIAVLTSGIYTLTTTEYYIPSDPSPSGY